MVHDYWWYVDDPAFVRRMLPGARSVLSFFEGCQKENGSLSSLPQWRYFDWVPEWSDAPQDADGSSALFDLHLLMAYRWAAARDLMLRTLTAPGLAQGALYFKFYMHQALAKVGEGNRYLDQLGDWREMLAKGLTTFAEPMDLPNNPSRSDCHDWSASPDVELLRTVLGVDSAAPGFARL
jgi:hypothetical protein